MDNIVEFLFHIRFIYRLADIEAILFLKHKIRRWLYILLGISVFFLFLFLRNFYILFLVFSGMMFSTVDAENNGLVVVLHEQGIFGNWKSTVEKVDFIIFSILLFHIFCGPFFVP